MPAVEDRLSLLEGRMDQIGATLGRMETLLLSLDQRVHRLDHRLGYSERRFDKMFLWLMGIQLTTLITIIGGLFGIVVKLL
jgi:hypothetical protein